MSRRLAVLAGFLFLLFAVLVGQASYVTFFHAPALDASPLNPGPGTSVVSDARGEIIAADGQILAQSVATNSSANPYKRIYPLGPLTAGEVGWVSLYHGDWGLESQYNNYLVPHSLTPQSFAQVLSPLQGTDNVNLTLYPELQRIAQVALAGRDGAAVVIDPRNGNVLGLYSNPTFNPAPFVSPSSAVEAAAYAKGIAPDKNGFPPLGLVALDQTFPPGSTFKIVTTSAAEVYKPSLLTKSYPVASYTTLPGTTTLLHNDANSYCGGTVVQMLPASCDQGYALLGLDLGATNLAKMANAFGFNSRIPIDMPYEVASKFPPVSSFTYNLPFLAYSSIGQGNVQATALQMALVAAGVADGGSIMTPHLMSSIVDPTGKVVQRYTPTQWLHPVTSSEANFTKSLMVGVVQNGTASGVGFLPQDQVGAKTGTAQVGNAAQNTNDWMIALAPASHPTVAVAVAVPYQANYDYGATVAGPIVKCLIEGALAIQNHQPSTGTSTTCPA